MNWKNTFDQEIRMAMDARAQGKEGQARVCARRAAGAVVREYFLRTGRPVRSASAYDLIKDLLNIPNLSSGVFQAAENLTLRVTEEFVLPVDVDLVESARLLADDLLTELGEG
jgi:hypothetical protein